MVKKPIFKNATLQKTYETQGYVILPVLNSEQVNHLIQLHDSTHDNHLSLPNCYNTSDHIKSIDTKRFIKDEISKVLQPLFDQQLNGFKPVYVNFIGKIPGDHSNRELHQDYSFSDEKEYDGYNIWIPLHDITKENSYFSLVRNSYQIFHSYRGRMLRHRFENMNEKIIDQLCTDLFPKAGHALIYNTGTLHYTPNNISKATRIAISVMTIPEEAPVSLYQSMEISETTIERYEVDEEFLLSYPAWKKIEGISPKEIIRYDKSDIRWSDFERNYYKINKDLKRPNFFKRLFSY